jgi:hypothetical protein
LHLAGLAVEIAQGDELRSFILCLMSGTSLGQLLLMLRNLIAQWSDLRVANCRA